MTEVRPHDRGEAAQQRQGSLTEARQHGKSEAARCRQSSMTKQGTLMKALQPGYVTETKGATIIIINKCSILDLGSVTVAVPVAVPHPQHAQGPGHTRPYHIPATSPLPNACTSIAYINTVYNIVTSFASCFCYKIPSTTFLMSTR